MAGNLAFLLNGIGLAVAFTILLVTANTMSIAVRERQQEIAVLKTLGFSSGLVMTLILSEALLIGILGGALGLADQRGRVAYSAAGAVLGRHRRAVSELRPVGAHDDLGCGDCAAAGTVRRILPGDDWLSREDYGDVAAGVENRHLALGT